MSLFRRSRSLDSAVREKTACSESRSVLSKDQITVFPWNKMCLEQPTVSFSGESRYLTPLWVSGIDEPREEFYRAENIIQHHQIIKEKIRAALKLLAFRVQHVLVQFWQARDVGKHQLLTTVHQPYGLGVASKELCLYRRDSERTVILVDSGHNEEDVSPILRVFRRGLPEWTSDLTNYTEKSFPQMDFAIWCNLHGYLALPVFDSTTSSCVGVLELLMSSRNTSYAFEVQQVHEALKTQNLTSPQVFDGPASNVPNVRRENELDKIWNILKTVCDIHSLPLAQAWAVSQSTSFVSHDKFIEKSCGSFDSRCTGKVCLSTKSLPFYVRDLRMWSFKESCKENHLDKSRSFIGRALLARGSSYCEDITKLCEEEYPLVHNACMSGLSGCFAIFLHSVEGDDGYVLEFFLPLDSKDGRYVSNLVQTLKLKVEVTSGFELGELLPLEVTQPPRDASYLSLSVLPRTKLISSTTTTDTSAFRMDSSAIESLFMINSVITENKQDGIVIDTDARVMNNGLQRRRKRKFDSHRFKVKANFKRAFINIRSPIPFKLMRLEKEVARRFNLRDKRLRLKYWDEVNDKILIACDVDLALAFETSGSNTIKIICEAD